MIPMGWVESFRKFDTWASRDTATWKLEWSNYSHPLCDYSFANYMKSKQIIWWEYRRGDNRQKWIPSDVLFESLIRHTNELRLLYKWYRLFEIRKDWVIDMIVLPKNTVFNEDEFDFCEEKTMEMVLNAIRFNCCALQLNILSDNYMV